MRRLTASMLMAFLVPLSAGCIHSTANGDWDPRPIHDWKCPMTGAHGFVLDETSQPLARVFVSFRPYEASDTEEAIDTDHSGAWELCTGWGRESTFTFEKSGYETAVLWPAQYPDQHEFEIVLRASAAGAFNGR